MPLNLKSVKIDFTSDKDNECILLFEVYELKERIPKKNPSSSPPFSLLLLLYSFSALLLHGTCLGFCVIITYDFYNKKITSCTNIRSLQIHKRLSGLDQGRAEPDQDFYETASFPVISTVYI